MVKGMVMNGVVIYIVGCRCEKLEEVKVMIFEFNLEVYVYMWEIVGL